jgi:2-dehydropantoate 2-reductase
VQILIVGAGAVGCYIGGQLARAGHRVTLVGRGHVTRAIQARGLKIQSFRGPSGAFVVKDIGTSETLADAIRQNPSLDLAIFTMKAYDAAPAAQDWALSDGPQIPVLCMQNGIGSEESVAEILGPDRVAIGTMTTAVSMPEPGMVMEETWRGIALAIDSLAYPVAAQAFSSTTLKIKAVKTAASLKWSKLLLNMIGNATSAVLDMPPAAIMGDKALFKVEIDALREALAIMRLQNIPAVNLPGAPAAVLASLLRVMPLPILQPLLRARFTSARGDKLPSLAVALRGAQKRTEVAWLNGAVAMSAQKLSRRAPINHALALLVSDIASGRIPWSMYRHKPDVLLAAVHAAQGNPRWRYGE